MNERFLRIKNGNVQLVTTNGNILRTYWTKGNCSRADWYNLKDESVQLQLVTGQLIFVAKNGNIIRTM